MVPYRVANLEQLAPDPDYRRSHTYYEIPAALDVETSKTGLDQKHDFAFVYLWQLAIGEYVVYGRTPEELAEFLPVLQAELRLAYDFRLVIFVHFLKYDFQFLKKYLSIDPDGFIARTAREPLRIRCNGCIELRDSYSYTEQPLELMGKEIGTPKLAGYDHDRIRTPWTELTEDELAYGRNDVLILTRYYTREANFYGGISRIPITATQRVTRVISHKLGEFGSTLKWRVYHQQLDPRKLEERTVLHMLHIAFFGGFNYCSRLWAGTDVCKATGGNVYGVDLDTSYGAQCLLHRYPRRKFKPLPTMPDGSVPERMLYHLQHGSGMYKDKALLITVRFDGLECLIPDMAFLPIYCKNYLYRDIERKRSMKNTHLQKCDHVETVLTDVDFRLVCKWYKWDAIHIDGILASGYDPMPEYVIDAIVQMIAQKKATQAEMRDINTYRKPTEQEKAEYTRIKSMVSRIYGVFVQDPIRMDYTWDDKAGKIVPAGIHDITMDEDDDRKKKFRPVLYQWGVWVASWARAEILSILEKIGAIGAEPDKNGVRWNRKVLYSDTDSCKFYGLGAEAFAVIEQYNAKKQAQLERFCSKRKIALEWLQGLGQLKLETYTGFKATGLKQYAQIMDGEFDYHISGLPRMDWIDEPDGRKRNRGCTFFDEWEDPAEKIEHFVADLTVPADKSHLTKTVCIDDDRCACITDEDGDCRCVSSRSSILLVPRAFKLKRNFIERLKDLDPDAVELSGSRNYGERG